MQFFYIGLSLSIYSFVRTGATFQFRRNSNKESDAGIAQPISQQFQLQNFLTRMKFNTGMCCRTLIL